MKGEFGLPFGDQPLVYAVRFHLVSYQAVKIDRVSLRRDAMVCCHPAGAVIRRVYDASLCMRSTILGLPSMIFCVMKELDKC